jgi:hypothetical protein
MPGSGLSPALGLGVLQGRALSAALDVGLKAPEAERYMLPQLPAVEVRWTLVRLRGCPCHQGRSSQGKM